MFRLRPRFTPHVQALVCCALLLFSVCAHATYGPPYNYSSPVGTKGGFTTIGAAINSYIGDEEAFCNGPNGSCGSHSYTVQYVSGGAPAWVAVTFTNSDGSTYTQYPVYIWATDTSGSGFQPKNVGGCAAMCTGGNGTALDSLGPPGSSGNGTTKDPNANVGTSLEGDPINAANGNEYRQETDLPSSRWLTFRRFYNSSSYVATANMGIKWRHSFDRSIVVMARSTASNGLIYAMRPDGSLVRFTAKSGVWKADVDQAETLTTSQDPVTHDFSGFSLRVAATNETETYDATGKLLSITDDNGWMTKLIYSDASTPQDVAPKPGLPIIITDPQGRALQLKYDAAGRLASATDPQGQQVEYSYTAAGLLGKVTFPGGTSLQYLYAESAYAPAGSTYPGELTGVIDEKGVRYETVTFSATNWALSSQFAAGAGKVTLSPYNISQNGGRPSSVVTPLGASLILYYSDDGGETLKPGGVSSPCGTECSQRMKSITYVNGYPSTSTDLNGVVTKTTYDANGLLTQEVDASGTAIQRTINTTWDVVHRAPLTRTTLDAGGNTVAREAWAYNSRGQKTAECLIDPAMTAPYACGSQPDAPSGVKQSLSTYCDATDGARCPFVGLLLTVDGPRTDVADVVRYGYFMGTDESGCGTPGGTCHRAGQLSQVTDPSGHVTAVVAYDQNGRPIRQRDANGVLTDVTYTARGWLASRTIRASPDGSASTSDATTTLTYDATGALKTVTDPDGVTQTLSYDDAHRLVDVADGQGNHIHYTLDAAGNRIREETFDSAGTSRRSLARKFNNLGQLITVTDGRGHVVFDATAAGSYDGNGNLVSGKDALGIVRKDTLDALNRVVASVANVNGSDSATKNTTTTLAFDALDRLRSVTDPDNLATTYSIDGLNNPIGQASPDTGAQSSTFDAAGNALTRVDAKGTVTAQAFDASGRRIEVSYADVALNVAFHYDETNGVTGCAGSYPIGRLTRVVEVAVTTVYCYDRQGRAAEIRQTQGTTTDVTNYAYTKAGRLAGVASPSGLVTAYGRDALGRISTVTVAPRTGAATPVVSAANYLPFGPLASYTLGNGQIVTRTFDANYQVTDITSAALNLHFLLNAAGYITALGDAPGASPAKETYAYDPLYRLTSVKDVGGNAVEAYTYSRAGDRLSKSAPGLATGTYLYQQGSHWLTGIGAASRAYDANGSMTANASAGAVLGFGYNARGQLTVLQQSGVTVARYAYNALDQRIGKTVESDPVRFVYDPSGKLLGEYGVASRDYIWLGGLLAGVIDTSSSGPTVAYVHADALGAPRAVVDLAGDTLWRWELKSNPFGEVGPTTSSSFVMNVRYPGQYFDAESGLMYNHHRFYDPTVGRYIQSDPIGLSAGSSTYAYVDSSPLEGVDPTGLDVVLLVNTRTVPTLFGRNAGHAAIAIGNDNDGWSFYQEGGLDPAGRQQTTHWKFPTLSALEGSLSDYRNRIGATMSISSAYDFQEGLRTMPLQDMLMNTWAQAHLQDPYKATTNNCGDFVLGALRSGGLHPTANSTGPTVPVWMSIAPPDDPGRFNPRAN